MSLYLKHKLFIYLKLKPIYLKFIEEYDIWSINSDSNMNSVLFLQSNYSDDILISENNIYKLVHYHNQTQFEILKEFATPEEVWEKVIKPDIEDYYGITIEE